MKKLIPVLLFLLSSSAFAVGSVTGPFAPPVERDDGSQLLPSEIAGYNMLVDGVTDPLSPLPADATSFTTSPISSGAHLIQIQTIDTAGRTSKRFYEVSATIPFADPNEPTGDGSYTVTP